MLYYVYSLGARKLVELAKETVICLLVEMSFWLLSRMPWIPLILDYGFPAYGCLL